MKNMTHAIALLLALALIVPVLGSGLNANAEAAKKYTVTEMAKGKWIKVENEGGPTLGYSAKSGVTILEDDGYAFKDLNKNGVISDARVEKYYVPAKTAPVNFSLSTSR